MIEHYYTQWRWIASSFSTLLRKAGNLACRLSVKSTNYTSLGITVNHETFTWKPYRRFLRHPTKLNKKSLDEWWKGYIHVTIALKSHLVSYQSLQYIRPLVDLLLVFSQLVNYDNNRMKWMVKPLTEHVELEIFQKLHLFILAIQRKWSIWL